MGSTRVGRIDIHTSSSLTLNTGGPPRLCPDPYNPSTHTTVWPLSTPTSNHRQVWWVHSAGLPQRREGLPGGGREPDPPVSGQQPPPERQRDKGADNVLWEAAEERRPISGLTGPLWRVWAASSTSVSTSQRTLTWTTHTDGHTVRLYVPQGVLYLSLQDIYTRRCRIRAGKTIQVSSHLNLRYRIGRANSERLRQSFNPVPYGSSMRTMPKGLCAVPPPPLISFFGPCATLEAGSGPGKKQEPVCPPMIRFGFAHVLNQIQQLFFSRTADRNGFINRVWTL